MTGSSMRPSVSNTVGTGNSMPRMASIAFFSLSGARRLLAGRLFSKFETHCAICRMRPLLGRVVKRSQGLVAGLPVARREIGDRFPHEGIIIDLLDRRTGRLGDPEHGAAQAEIEL